MPTFIVRHAAEKPRFATVDAPEIVIGRDPSCTVVLPGATVSRQHLVIREYPGPQYIIDGVKPSNPVMLNGSFIRERVALSEGDELQVADFHVIFSLRSRAQDHYMKEVSHFDGVCVNCKWSGRVGSLNRAPKCPSCGTPITQRKDDLAVGAAGSLAESQGATSYLQPVDVAKMHELLRLKTKAKFVTGGAATGRSLHPGKVSTLGSGGTADYSADGMLMGGMATVGWEEDSWVARWKGVVCRMKHNGDSMKIAKLKPGDVLTVGSSDFTLVVD